MHTERKVNGQFLLELQIPYSRPNIRNSVLAIKTNEKKKKKKEEPSVSENESKTSNYHKYFIIPFFSLSNHYKAQKENYTKTNDQTT